MLATLVNVRLAIRIENVEMEEKKLLEDGETSVTKIFERKNHTQREGLSVRSVIGNVTSQSR